MKRTWTFGLWMLAVACGVQAAHAEPAPGGVTATIVDKEKKVLTADEYYKLGQETYNNGELLESIWMYKSAADLGHEKSMMMVANFYESGLRLKDAMIYYRKAADLGNTTAMIQIALMLDGGDEVQIPRDYAEALKLMTQAANKGDKVATVYLASSYGRGGLGLTQEERNSPQALEWLKRAAELENVPSLQAVIRAYQVGMYGLTPNPVEADSWNAKLVELQNRGKPKEVEVKKTSKKRR